MLCSQDGYLNIPTFTIYLLRRIGKRDPTYRAGKLNLVDLAGSERAKRTGAAGERLDEGKAINLSLSGTLHI